MDVLDAQRKRAAARQVRENYAELCFYYPQYTLTDVMQLDMGDIELLLNVAHKLYYQDKLDTLIVTAAAADKKGFKAVRDNLTNLIKKLKAQL